MVIETSASYGRSLAISYVFNDSDQENETVRVCIETLVFYSTHHLHCSLSSTLEYIQYDRNRAMQRGGMNQ